MTTGSNTGGEHAELFVADFYPQLGEYLAERHASGYDAVAARVRFLSWLAQHVDQSAIRPPRVDPDGAADVSPGDVMARNALTDYIAETGERPEPDAGEIAELGRRVAAGREAEEALAAGGALTGDERAGLAWAADRGRQAKDRLTEAHLGLVSDIAGRYTSRGVPFLELVQAGSLGLSRAAEKFDVAKGYTFSVYATWWIRQAVTRAVVARAQPPRISDQLAKSIADIVIVQRRLARELGREPTPEELAAELGTSPE
jgi:RNA polymerase primary sigma factor